MKNIPNNIYFYIDKNNIHDITIRVPIYPLTNVFYSNDDCVNDELNSIIKPGFTNTEVKNELINKRIIEWKKAFKTSEKIWGNIPELKLKVLGLFNKFLCFSECDNGDIFIDISTFKEKKFNLMIHELGHLIKYPRDKRTTDLINEFLNKNENDEIVKLAIRNIYFDLLINYDMFRYDKKLVGYKRLRKYSNKHGLFTKIERVIFGWKSTDDVDINKVAEIIKRVAINGKWINGIKEFYKVFNKRRDEFLAIIKNARKNNGV